MTNNVSDETLGQLARKQHDLFRRVREGSLDADMVLASLQGLIEGRYAYNPPSWWRAPERQLERARQLWPDAVLPEPPVNFVPHTKTEVLLLHVPDSFDSLWDKVVAPSGYTKYRNNSVNSDKLHLRLAPSKIEFTQPVWLAFDPEHGRGEPPQSFLGRSTIAASEVFSALIQFPDWPRAWSNGASAPNLSGYLLKYNTHWSHVPYLARWSSGHQLKLDICWVPQANVYWSSPSVRKC